MDAISGFFNRLALPLGRVWNASSRMAVWLPPVAWISLFFIVPFFIVLKISFAETVFAAPPYSALVEWTSDATFNIQVNLNNFKRLLLDDLYLSAYVRSLVLASMSTVICLILGFPMAYGIAQAPTNWRTPLLMMIILPFWTSFLIRVYAWMGLLSNKGIINETLISLGLISSPLPLLYNNFAVCLGIVYCYLPFMILPLYANLEKLDPRYLEAAADLGARPWRTFFRVTLPLARPGIFAGSMLVFIPAVGEFVIPELLGGPENIMVGKVLWGEFFQNQDWPIASAMAVALLVMLVLPMIILQRYNITRGDSSNA